MHDVAPAIDPGSAAWMLTFTALIFVHDDAGSGPVLPRLAEDTERLLLDEDDYSFIILGILNPVLDSMQGRCASSHLERMRSLKRFRV